MHYYLAIHLVFTPELRWTIVSRVWIESKHPSIQGVDLTNPDGKTAQEYQVAIHRKTVKSFYPSESFGPGWIFHK